VKQDRVLPSSQEKLQIKGDSSKTEDACKNPQNPKQPKVQEIQVYNSISKAIQVEKQ